MKTLLLIAVLAATTSLTSSAKVSGLPYAE